MQNHRLHFTNYIPGPKLSSRSNWQAAKNDKNLYKIEFQVRFRENQICSATMMQTSKKNETLFR